MRKTRKIPNFGQSRTVRGFLWLPVEIRIRSEAGQTTSTRRWLETASWEEIYTNGKSANFWNKTRWLD